MKLHTKAKSSNYCAQIVKLPKPLPHPNADRLQIMMVNGCSVITGLIAKEGDLYCYFPLECKINSLFLAWSNSFSEPTLNADGKTKGFFPNSCRVKAVKLRGQPSMGYIIPVRLLYDWLSTIDTISISLEDFAPGLEFDSIGNITICEKYIPASNKGPSTTPKSRDHRVARHNKVIEGQFRFHTDTAQLGKNIHTISPDNVITITYKVHGTSTIHSKVLCNRKLRFRDKVAKFFGVPIQETQYDYLYSSRAVIKNGTEWKKKEHNHYYKEDIWEAADNILRPCLRDGYTIYAEIVGFTPNGRAIQKGYDYGCDQGQFDIYVYRVTYTNAQNDVFELSYPQIERYCAFYALKTVPILYHGRADKFATYLDSHSITQWQDMFLSLLKDKYLEKDCYICKNKVPAEGIVVAIEGEQWNAFKLKSFYFLEGETKALDSGVVDIETEETNEQNNQEEVDSSLRV